MPDSSKCVKLSQVGPRMIIIRVRLANEYHNFAERRALNIAASRGPIQGEGGREALLRILTWMRMDSRM